MTGAAALEGAIVGILGFYQNIAERVGTFYAANSRAILDSLHAIFSKSFTFVLVSTVLFTVAYAVIAIALLLKRKGHELPVSDDQLPLVTVQIPTYNELAALNCAKRCLEFDYPKDKYEIIIGDDSTDKAVSAKIGEFAEKSNGGVIVTMRGPNIGYKAGNLNHMLKHSKGEYIVIFDSDFLPEKDFLRRIIAPFVHQADISAVQAKWVAHNFSQNLVSKLGGMITMLTHNLGLPFLDMVRSNAFIAGSAEAIKKKDLIELGGWKNGSLTEDIEYSLRLTNAGKKIVYLEDLCCECETPFTVKDLCKQQMRWAYGVISACKDHFFSLLRNKAVSLRSKASGFLLLSGYLITLQFFLLGILGFLSVITDRPEPVIWGKLFSESARNALLTLGFTFTTILVLIAGKRVRHVPKMVFSSFTIGLVVMYFTNLGIFKAVFNRPMQWFILQKGGNTSIY